MWMQPRCAPAQQHFWRTQRTRTRENPLPCTKCTTHRTPTMLLIRGRSCQQMHRYQTPARLRQKASCPYSYFPFASHHALLLEPGGFVCGFTGRILSSLSPSSTAYRGEGTGVCCTVVMRCYSSFRLREWIQIEFKHLLFSVSGCSTPASDPWSFVAPWSLL